MSDLALSIQGIAFGYGAARVLDGLDLQVRRGEILALLGPSGCGKTTLLRCLAGFERIEEGSIRFGEQLVADAGTHRPPGERPVGMVFQNLALWPHMNALQQLVFAGKGSRRECRARARRLLDALGLDGMERRKPHQLSGGQAQRLALGRALMGDPEVLILDEPLSSVDPVLALEVGELLKKLNREMGVTLIYVTHRREEAFHVGDRVAVMQDGRVVQVGSPREIDRQPRTEFVARFLGPCNILDGTVRDGRLLCILGELPVESQPGRVRCVLRDHGVRCVPQREGLPRGRVLSTTYGGRDWQVVAAVDDLSVVARSDRAWEAGETCSLEAVETPWILEEEAG